MNILLSLLMRTHYILQYSWVLRLPDCIVPNDTAPDFPASRARMRAGGKIRSFQRPAFYFSLLGLSLLLAPSPCFCLCNHPPCLCLCNHSQCCPGLPLVKRKATAFRRSCISLKSRCVAQSPHAKIDTFRSICRFAGRKVCRAIAP
jgi:hypothetical protein